MRCWQFPPVRMSLYSTIKRRLLFRSLQFRITRLFTPSAGGNGGCTCRIVDAKDVDQPDGHTGPAVDSLDGQIGLVVEEIQPLDSLDG